MSPVVLFVPVLMVVFAYRLRRAELERARRNRMIADEVAPLLVGKRASFDPEHGLVMAIDSRAVELELDCWRLRGAPEDVVAALQKKKLRAPVEQRVTVGDRKIRIRQVRWRPGDGPRAVALAESIAAGIAEALELEPQAGSPYRPRVDERAASEIEERRLGEVRRYRLRRTGSVAFHFLATVVITFLFGLLVVTLIK